MVDCKNEGKKSFKISSSPVLLNKWPPMLQTICFLSFLPSLFLLFNYFVLFHSLHVVLSFCPFSLFCYFFLNFSLFCYFFVYPLVVLFLSLSFSCSIFFVYLYIDWCYFIFLSSPIYFFFLISLIDYLSISLSSHIL